MSLWHGRFTGSPRDAAAALSESVSFDRRLYRHDIVGTQAHVRMLSSCGIIPSEDSEKINSELDRIASAIESGSFEFRQELEDIHMNIEASLIDALGVAGARVHTARSRNDQVATDFRLFLRDEIAAISAGTRAMQKALIAKATEHRQAVMPGYTHMQRAQPVLFAHHLLAYVEMLGRDVERLHDCRTRLNRLPLGAGAIAGTTLPIDRQAVADDLGFDEVARNSMDAVSDRDFAIELLAALSILMMHLSRLSEDLIFWSTAECGFVSIDEGFCTGSSLMPQKRNPDMAELTRGKTGRVYGALMTLLTVMKGLPLTYNRDMQEDKEPVFDAVDTVRLVLEVCAPLIETITVNTDAMAAAAADPALMVTDLAEYLVTEGVPFRDAHEQVGGLVAWCESNQVALDELTLAQMKTCIPEATAAMLKLFCAVESVRARSSQGGTSPDQVDGQLAYWNAQLGE